MRRARAVVAWLAASLFLLGFAACLVLALQALDPDCRFSGGVFLGRPR